MAIGMATYDDYDGVYFTVQAIRLFHPEITGETEIIVVDNHPDGPCSNDLKALENWVPGYRYVPFNRLQGTYWTGDPKEIITLVILAIYAGYLWLGRSSAWRGARASVLCVVNFLVVLFSYSVVNLYLSGFHRFF